MDTLVNFSLQLIAMGFTDVRQPLSIINDLFAITSPNILTMTSLVESMFTDQYM